MKPQDGLSRKEREFRKRMQQLLAARDGFIHGSIIRMARTCGHPRCKCAIRGEKHISYYLGQTRKRKTRMKYIPKNWETRIKRWVRNHQQASDLLEKISKESWQCLNKSKLQK